MLYRDSSVLFNPRNGMKIGKWRLGQQENKLMLMLDFTDHTSREYFILQKRSNMLALAWKQGSLHYGMKLTSDAKAHANMLNDPFHPSNNQWRIHPDKQESGIQIRAGMLVAVSARALAS